MKFITESRLLMELIISLAAGIGIPPEAVLAIIEVESDGNPYATAYNQNYSWVNMQAKRPANCSANTESVHQRTAWGLMQVMGATARQAGFEGWLPELVDPEVNMRTAIAYLAQLRRKHFETHGIDGVIAAYNRGAPRKSPDGNFVNQGYVDRVKALMPKYEAIVKIYLEGRGRGTEQAATDKSAVTDGAEISDNPAGDASRQLSEPELLKKEPCELRRIAKGMGLKPASNASKEKLVTMILAAVAKATKSASENI